MVQHTNGTEAAAVIPLVFQGNSVQVSAQRVILPVVGSLFNHSCNPNTVRHYLPSSARASPAGQVEFIASRDIRVGEELTIDYLGAKAWGRQRRREYLHLSKDFQCSCARCTRAAGDREASLVCPGCLPVGENEQALVVREAGFCVPVDALAYDESRFGYITCVDHTEGWEGGDRITGKWTCSKNCAHTFSTADLQAMALPVHTGAPAGTYYELLEYAEKLAQELEDAEDETIASGAGQQYHFAMHQDVCGCTALGVARLAAAIAAAA